MTTAELDSKSLAKSPDALLFEYAKGVLETVGFDYDEFASRYRYLLRKERAKWFDVIIDAHVDQMQRELRLQSRMDITRKAAPTPGKDRGAALLQADYEKYYEKWATFELSDGTPLRLATRKQMEAQRDVWRAQGRTCMARAAWAGSIIKKMGTAETVGEALDGKAICELHDEAEARWKEAE